MTQAEFQFKKMEKFQQRMVQTAVYLMPHKVCVEMVKMKARCWDMSLQYQIHGELKQSYHLSPEVQDQPK